MTKKKITAIVEDMVATVQKKHGLDELEARTMVGIALNKSKAAILDWIALPVAPAFEAAAATEPACEPVTVEAETDDIDVDALLS